MSSKFLSGGTASEGISLSALSDGTLPLNVASCQLQDLTPGLTLRADENRKLISSQIGLSDLNFTPLATPYAGGDIEITAGNLVASNGDVETSSVPSLNTFANVTSQKLVNITATTSPAVTTLAGKTILSTISGTDVNTHIKVELPGFDLAGPTLVGSASIIGARSVEASTITTGTIFARTGFTDVNMNPGAGLNLQDGQLKRVNKIGTRAIEGFRNLPASIPTNISLESSMVVPPATTVNITGLTNISSANVASLGDISSSGVPSLNTFASSTSSNISTLNTKTQNQSATPDITSFSGTVRTATLSSLDPIGLVRINVVSPGLDFGGELTNNNIVGVYQTNTRDLVVKNIFGGLISPILVNRTFSMQGNDLLDVASIGTNILGPRFAGSNVQMGANLDFINTQNIINCPLVQATNVNTVNLLSGAGGVATNVTLGSNLDFGNVFNLIRCPSINGIRPSGGVYSESSLATFAGVQAEQNILGLGATKFGSLTVPGGTFVAGDCYAFKLGGTLSCDNNDIFILRIRTNFGQAISPLFATITVQADGIQAAAWWEVEVEFIIVAVGLANVAKVRTNGAYTYFNSTNVSKGYGVASLTETLFDTTVENTLNVTYQTAEASITAFNPSFVSLTKLF